MDSSLPMHGRTLLGDNFNEDETEQKFLRSKPTCFAILGKPGCGKTTLAKNLAQLWRCELVHSTDIIQREIELGTEIGKKMNEVLLKGEQLSNDFVMELIKEKVQSPEVAHHGYIVDGLPCLDESVMPVTEQIDMIKNWGLNPDFVINIKIPDDDLFHRCTNMRIDSITGDIYPKEMWNPEKIPEAPKLPLSEEEEEEAEEEEAEAESVEKEGQIEFFEIDQETKDRLVRSPELLPDAFKANIDKFKDIALRPLEEFMTNHDQQYLIELDGNYGPKTLFQQLMMKLDTFSLRRAAVPIRLQNPDEEELPDEIETEELLRTVSAYQMPAPRYRWRRSKWGRLCPVALKQGHIMQGKPDLAVSFLDKIYVLSSPEAMGKFLKNPRPYLMPPHPKAPVKICVLGYPKSGKTTLCKELASIYNAHVFDVVDLMKDKFAEAKKNNIEKARQDALESAITLIQNKLEQEATERHEARKKEEQQKKALLEMEKSQQENENGTGDERKEEDDTTDPESTDEVPPTTTDDETTETTDTDVREPSPVPPVTPDHPDVIKIVEDAVAKEEKQEIKLPADVYVRVLKEAVDAMLEEKLKADQDAPEDGSWILDNFPQTKDQWVAMTEVNLLPDEVICLTDKSNGNEALRNRYYELNKEEITKNYRKRMIDEKYKQLKEEEEIMKQREAAMEAESTQDETRTELTEDTNANEEKDEEENTEAADETETETKTVASTDGTVTSEVSSRDKIRKEIEELETMYIGRPTSDAPEYQEFQDMLRNFEKEWSSLQTSIGGVATPKPLMLNIVEKSEKEISDLAVERIQSPFGYKAWEFSGMDVDEEEEDNNADSGDGEEEEEEDEEVRRHSKKQFGYTKNFDPVSLKSNFVLWPGNPDIAAKYREKVYYFKSPENRSMFVSNPTEYVPIDQPLTPPPPRILVLGARGSGKTLHGKYLAKKLGVFHISFRERLQELILPNTGRKLGPEHEEDHLLNTELKTSIEEAVENAVAETADEAAAKPSDGEEEEKFTLTDEQEAIRSCLQDDELLPPEILEKIVPNWWHEEPYKSTGFILEGFPRNIEECNFLAQSGLFPDVALFLMVEDVDVITRLLPSRMEKWRRRRDHKNAKKNAIKEKKEQLRKEKIEKRRADLIAERDAKRAEKEAAKEEEDEDNDDEEEEEDIEEILQMEFEEQDEEEEDEEEGEEDAADRMKGEYGEWFDDDITKLQALQDQLEENMIPKLEVQASRKPKIVQYLIDTKLKSLVENRQSLFEKVFPISQELASKMLLMGYKHPSSFGKWDPVKLLEEDEVIQSGQNSPNTLIPVIYHQYIYYLSSIESRDKFINHPMKYVYNRPPAKPVVPIKMAILGPPKSGKTTLATRFARQFGALRMSVGEAIRLVMQKQPKSMLSQCLVEHLLKGETVPDELAVEALYTILLDTTCTTKGYILDGFPTTKEQLSLLEKKEIVPVQIFEIKVSRDEIVKRATKDRTSIDRIFPLHDSHEIFVVKLAAYDTEIQSVKQFYTTVHQNWTELNGSYSKWKLWKTCVEEGRKSIRQIQTYLDRIIRGEAASLHNLCISPSEFHHRLGVYGEYCPVALNARGELIDCSVTTSMEFTAEYRSKYYKLSGKEDFEEFLANPSKYVPPDAQRSLPPPELLPKRRTREDVKQMFPKAIEMKGYCPVSYLDGKLRYEALVEGNLDFVAEYKNKLYTFASEDELHKFMRLPEKYCDLKLPHKMPPKKQPMSLTSLPMLGYLEQGAANSIIKALTAAGCFKPKYPFISVTESSLLYIAYHLKAFNPRNPEYLRRKYKKLLDQFEERCQLILYLGTNMTRRYKRPAERPIDFDHKMGQFLSLSPALSNAS